MRNLYWGFILIVIGILLLLDNLGVADFGDMIHDYWPLILVFWGLGILLRRRSVSTSPSPAGNPQGDSQEMGSQPGVSPGAESQQPGSSQFGSSAGEPNQSESELLHQSSAFGDISVNVTSPRFPG